VGFKTVQSYSARIKEKLNLANINELMREAIRWQESQEAPRKDE
jgi:DNA-binding CsgD family transcriptional regulator